MEGTSCIDPPFLWYVHFSRVSVKPSSAHHSCTSYTNLARERVTDFEHFDKHSSKVINIFQQRADAGESLDIQDVFGRFTLDAAGEFVRQETSRLQGLL